jgi:hypothetical protein
MVEPCTVIIAAPELIDALRRRAASGGEVLCFSDNEPLKALDAITTRHPRVIVLERLFAVTSRGAALINRIKADPALVAAEIRVESHDGTYSRVSPRRSTGGGAHRPNEAPAPTPAAAPAQVAPVSPAPSPADTVDPNPALDYRGTRRVPRFRMKDGTEIQVDGALARIVDLSTMGAQIISQMPLKPQQRVRITLADDLGVVKFNGTVAWASFEIPKGISRYRAGLEFRDAEAGAVEAFCRRHQAS